MTSAQAAAETILEPGLPIIDPHTHPRDGSYMLRDILADVHTGHNVLATVFVQITDSTFRVDGPEDFKYVGEVEFADGIAAQCAGGRYGAIRACHGIVGNARLMMGAGVAEVLDAMIRVGGGRLRGLRQSLNYHEDASGKVWRNQSKPVKGQMLDAKFREGFACLAPAGLSWDANIYHTQLPELVELARAFPQTTIIVNHGCTVLVQDDANNWPEAFAEWRAGLPDLAACPNVYMKLGGFMQATPVYEFQKRPGRPSSQDIATALRPGIEVLIGFFGAERCMFESCFPTEGRYVDYATLWNGFKRITADYSAEEKRALYTGTAARAYRLDTVIPH